MQKNMIQSYKDYNSEEYSKKAMGMMWQQQQYMPNVIEKYVARGSILSCSYGGGKSRIDMLRDKGVYNGDNPVFTIDDCRAGKNIHSFCTCQSCHESFGNRCVPQPVERWQQTNGNVFAFNNRSGEYVEILRDSAVLPCGRGGCIIIEETIVPLAKEPSEPACYDTHRKEFQYKNRNLLYTYTKSELEHFVECMDKNLIMYDSKKKKYVFDMDEFYKNKKWFDPSDDNSDNFVKLYLFFKAEIILRKFDLIFEAYYKDWLVNNVTVDVSNSYNDLFRENTQLIQSIRTKFMSKDEVNNKKTTFFTNVFFKELVDDKHIWDIKKRVVVMNFKVNDIKLEAIKHHISEKAFNDAVRGKVEYDIDSKVHKFTLVVEPYGKSSYLFNGTIRKRDYYGNYNYGYVGMEYFYYRKEKKTLDHILFWSDVAQRLSNGNPFEGDPQEDAEAIKDGAKAWTIDNNIKIE